MYGSRMHFGDVHGGSGGGGGGGGRDEGSVCGGTEKIGNPWSPGVAQAWMNASLG
jgi:hypothetical protein